MGAFLSSFLTSKDEKKDDESESETDSQDWHEEMQKEYGHPSWSRLIGKRLSKKKPSVKVKKISSSEVDENLDLATVVLSPEFQRLDSEIKETKDSEIEENKELGTNETTEELDNVKNALEEVIDENVSEKVEIVEENTEQDNVIVDGDSPVLDNQVGGFIWNNTLEPLYKIVHYKTVLVSGERNFIATDKRGYPHNIFLISSRKHMLWYSLEAPCRGTSNEYPQHMFLWRNKKDISIFQVKKAPRLLLWECVQYW